MESWTYVGHGQWAQTESDTPVGDTGETARKGGWEVTKDPEWVHKWRSTVDEDLHLHKEVMEKGYPNRWGAWIPVSSKWNLELFAELLQGYHNEEVIEWM